MKTIKIDLTPEMVERGELHNIISSQVRLIKPYEYGIILVNGDRLYQNTSNESKQRLINKIANEYIKEM